MAKLITKVYIEVCWSVNLYYKEYISVYKNIFNNYFNPDNFYVPIYLSLSFYCCEKTMTAELLKSKVFS